MDLTTLMLNKSQASESMQGPREGREGPRVWCDPIYKNDKTWHLRAMTLDVNIMAAAIGGGRGSK